MCVFLCKDDFDGRMGVVDSCVMRHCKPYGLPLDHTRGAGTVPLDSYFVKCDINPAREMLRVCRCLLCVSMLVCECECEFV